MFDEIPEDKVEGYPCPDCENGSVTMNAEKTLWECDMCNFEYITKDTK